MQKGDKQTLTYNNSHKMEFLAEDVNQVVVWSDNNR